MSVISNSYNRINKGYINRIHPKYNDTTSFIVPNGGVVHINDGTNDKMLVVNADLTKAMTGLGTNAWYYIYVAPPADGSSIIAVGDINYATTVPAFSTTLYGWYHTVNTTWRCIGILRTNTTPAIVPFSLDNKLWITTDSYLNVDVNGIAPSTNWTTATFTAPLGNMSIYGYFISVYSNCGANVMYRKKGTAGTGSELTYIYSSMIRCSYRVRLVIDANKQGEFKLDQTGTNTIFYSTTGFYIPEGM